MVILSSKSAVDSRVKLYLSYERSPPIEVTHVACNWLCGCSATGFMVINVTVSFEPQQKVELSAGSFSRSCRLFSNSLSPLSKAMSSVGHTPLSASYRAVFTQESKHRIGLDFFPSCIIHTAGPKKR